MPISRISQFAQDAVDAELARRYRRGESRKLYIDNLIERTKGRTFSRAEFEQPKAKIAQHLKGLFRES